MGKDKTAVSEKPKAEQGTFAAIWQEGEEEIDTDWLDGGGLKFHVSADKAFKPIYDKSKQNLEIFDPLAAKGNDEVLAEERKKRAAGMMTAQIQGNRKEQAKKAEDDDKKKKRKPLP